MPLYEFICRNCQEKFEKLCSAACEISSITCPKCGQQKAEKRFSMFATNSKSGSGSGNFRSSAPASGSGCSSCSSHNCSSCH